MEDDLDESPIPDYETVSPSSQENLQSPSLPPISESLPYAAEPSYFTRPNRYFGPPSTWRSWTAKDRAITNALDRIRSGDLSVHLYNAYALKAQGQQNAEHRRKLSKGKGRETQSDGTEDVEYKSMVYIPPKIWTAWPLPPNLVPRENQEIRLGASSIHRPPDVRPSANLEEALIAATLKTAKDRWNNRAWLPTEVNRTDSNTKPSSDQQWNQEKPYPANNVHGQTDQEDTDAVSELLEDDMAPDSPRIFSSQAFMGPASSESESNERPIQKRRCPAVIEVRPTFTADDERARKLLLPSTRHIIANLDNLLLGLHKARKVYGEGRYSRSNSEFSDDAEANTEGSTRGDHKRSTSRNRGRKRKRRSSGMQIDTNGNDTHSGTSKSRTTSRRGLLTAGGTALRDWSDVLGMAALTGWDTKVVGRASERCAKLFGENMMFRTFHEGRTQTGDTSNFTEEFALVESEPEGPEAESEDLDGQGKHLVRSSEPCTRCRNKKIRCDAPELPPVSPGSVDPLRRYTCRACAGSSKTEKCSGITCQVAPSQQATSKTCPYPTCERYSIPFLKRYHLKRHIASIHQGEAIVKPQHSSRDLLVELTDFEGDAEGAAACPVRGCSKVYTRRSRLYEHIRQMHPEVDVKAIKKLHLERHRSRSRSRSKAREVVDRAMAGDEEDVRGESEQDEPTSM